MCRLSSFFISESRRLCPSPFSFPLNRGNTGGMKKIARKPKIAPKKPVRDHERHRTEKYKSWNRL